MADDAAETSAPLGMWVFLASEIMMFGALFMALAVTRWADTAGWVQGSTRLHLWMGTANTAVLLASSGVVAMAVVAVHRGRRREAAWELGVAALLGVVFLAIKGTEWVLEWQDGLMLPQAAALRPFFEFYFLATGLHAFHLTCGVALVAALALRRSGEAAVRLGGLYWHFVDVVWIFLFPILYLAR
ncbi:MAG: cytochrome c oxidase subunit 3 [Actinomycetota bacterium]